MLLAKTAPTLTDSQLRRMVAARRERLAKFRSLKAPACLIKDAEALLARGEAELERRTRKGLVN